MPIDLKAIREREAKATKGPWRACCADRDGACGTGIIWGPSGDLHLMSGATGGEVPCPSSGQRAANAMFAAHARTDVHDLLRIVEIQTAALLELEYSFTCNSTGDLDFGCPWCDTADELEAARAPADRKTDIGGMRHRHDCKLDAGLNAAGLDSHERRFAERERLRKERSK